MLNRHVKYFLKGYIGDVICKVYSTINTQFFSSSPHESTEKITEVLLLKSPEMKKYFLLFFFQPET